MDAPDNFQMTGLVTNDNRLSQLESALMGLTDVQDKCDLTELKDCIAVLSDNLRGDECEAEVMELLLRMELPRLSSQLIMRLETCDLMTLSKEVEILREVLISVYDINITLASRSVAYANHLRQNHMDTIIIQHLVKEDFVSCLNDNFATEWHLRILTLFNNILRAPGNSLTFKTEHVKAALMKGASAHENKRFSTLSTLCLAYIVDGSECNIMNSVLDAVKDAAADRASSMFSVEELLSPLTVLTMNDVFTKSLIQSDGVALLKSLCDPERPKELQYATKIIWNILFDRDIRETLQEKEDLENFLMDLQDGLSHHFDPILEDSRKNVQGSLWLLCGELNPVRLSQRRYDIAPYFQEEPQAMPMCVPEVPMMRRMKSAPSPPSRPPPNVFISYCWSNKAEVLKVYSQLKECNIDCWLDTEQMSGSTLEAMAKGIENARVVLLCYSEAYYNSPNCRMEAEYAVRKERIIVPLSMQYKYKPDGWLGIILGTKLYYDFSGKKEFHEVFQPLHSSLRKHLADDDAPHNLREPTQDSALSSTKEHASGKTPPKKAIHEISSSRSIRPDVISWSCEDVSRWLQENNLYEAVHSFSGINGRMLSRLLSLECRSPEFFYSSLSDKMCMSLGDILRFLDVVDDTLREPAT